MECTVKERCNPSGRKVSGVNWRQIGELSEFFVNDFEGDWVFGLHYMNWWYELLHTTSTWEVLITQISSFSASPLEVHHASTMFFHLLDIAMIDAYIMHLALTSWWSWCASCMRWIKQVPWCRWCQNRFKIERATSVPDYHTRHLHNIHFCVKDILKKKRTSVKIVHRCNNCFYTDYCTLTTIPCSLLMSDILYSRPFHRTSNLIEKNSIFSHAFLLAVLW